LRLEANIKVLGSRIVSLEVGGIHDKLLEVGGPLRFRLEAKLLRLFFEIFVSFLAAKRVN
jgi:hypothetical protein